MPGFTTPKLATEWASLPATFLNLITALPVYTILTEIAVLIFLHAIAQSRYGALKVSISGQDAYQQSLHFSTRTTPIPHEGTTLRDKGAGSGIFKVKDQQRGAQATANVRFFSPPDGSRAESPDRWPLDNTKSEHQAHRDRINDRRDRVRDPIYCAPECSNETSRQRLNGDKTSQEAAKGPPIKSEASGDEQCRDIRHTRAQVGQAFSMPLGLELIF